MKWFEKERQQWITETLQIFGFIQRQHLMRKFGISIPQASADLKQYQKDNPGVMKYDSSAKRYISVERL